MYKRTHADTQKKKRKKKSNDLLQCARENQRQSPREADSTHDQSNEREEERERIKKKIVGKVKQNKTKQRQRIGRETMNAARKQKSNRCNNGQVIKKKKRKKTIESSMTFREALWIDSIEEVYIYASL